MTSESQVNKFDAQGGNEAGQVNDDAVSRFIMGIFSLPETAIKVHMLIAALLYPSFLRAPKEDENVSATVYPLWCLVGGFVVLLINIIGAFAIIDCFILAILPLLKVQWLPLRQLSDSLGVALAQANFIRFAKAVFVFIAWTVSLFAIIVVNNEKMISALLFAVEDEATQTRDESVMLIRAGQAGLRGLNAKLWGEERANQGISPSELIKSIGPLALLFLNKERSILRWGMVGANAAIKGIKFIQSLGKEK